MRRGRATVVVLAIGALVVLGAGAYAAVVLTRPVPPVRLVALRVPHVFPGKVHGLAWPRQGAGAVGIANLGMIGTHGPEDPVPIASVAKVMTAFLVLRDHPIDGEEDGPEITVEPDDVHVYKYDRETGQSVARVRKGEHLTERQALEALLLPSANNVATLLAKWDSGSEDAFVVKMNILADVLGLQHTHYADASGLSPATVSTASDQTHLAMQALKVPTFVDLVSLPEVRLPVAGLEQNVDRLLGKYGIFGVKTGSTSAAGGCFVFAARIPVPGGRMTAVGAVTGQPATSTEPNIVQAALDSAAKLVKSVPYALRTFASVTRRARLGRLIAPWMRPVRIRASESRPLIGWPGLRVHVRLRSVRRLRAPVHAGQRVAVAVVRVGHERAKVRLVASRAVPKPSLGWRLEHP